MRKKVAGTCKPKNGVDFGIAYNYEYYFTCYIFSFSFPFDFSWKPLKQQ